MREQGSGRTKLVLGAVFPVVLAILIVAFSLWSAIREDDWGIAVGSVPLTVLILGPFAICYFLISSEEVSLVIGALLVCVTIWAIFRSFTDVHSTAGLNVLWIPFVGYPLALLGAFLDRLSR